MKTVTDILIEKTHSLGWLKGDIVSNKKLDEISQRVVQKTLTDYRLYKKSSFSLDEYQMLMAYIMFFCGIGCGYKYYLSTDKLRFNDAVNYYLDPDDNVVPLIKKYLCDDEHIFLKNFICEIYPVIQPFVAQLLPDECIDKNNVLANCFSLGVSIMKEKAENL